MQPRPRRLRPPAGTPTRPVGTSCATGTARSGPSTCRAPASSSPTRPSPDAPRPLRRARRPVQWPRTTVGSSTARHLDRPRRHPDRDRRPGRSCATRGSCRRSSVRGSCSPATTSSPTTCCERIEHADYLYVTHLHADHLDEPWLPQHLRRDIPILLPGYPTREQERTLAALGFTEFVRTVDGEELELAPGLTIAIHVETSITDGPGGDSALVGQRRHDAAREPERLPHHRSRRAARPRPGRPALAAVLRRDLVPDGLRRCPTTASGSCATPRSRASSPGRCATSRPSMPAAVVPSAGPPAFLDHELFHLNVIDGDELSIFPDQRAFLTRLDGGRPRGHPGDPRHRDRDHAGRDQRHPSDRRGRGRRDLRPTRRRTSPRTRPTGRRGCDELKASWTPPTTDLLATLQAWWEPLLAMAPTLCAAVGANVLFRAGELAHRDRLPERRGARLRRRAVRVPVRHRSASWSRRSWPPRAVDWSNSLFLSCRFRAWREGDVQRVPLQLLQVAVGRAHAPHRGRGAAQARSDRPRSNPTSSSATSRAAPCPHRNADLDGVRRDRGRRAGLHPARLALRPRDRSVPERRRPPAAVRRRRKPAEGCRADQTERARPGRGSARSIAMIAGDRR